MAFAQNFGQACCHKQADGHRFAVQVIAVARHILYGMGKSMPQIEQGASSAPRGFPLVHADDISLDFTATPDDPGEALVPGIETRQFPELFIQFPVCEQAIFDDLRHTGGEFTGGKCLEESGVNEHSVWLPECTDQIFALRRIDTGFSPHRTVHHGEQRGWHLVQSNAPVPGGCGKPDQVTYHPAPDGKQTGFATEMIFA